MRSLVSYGISKGVMMDTHLFNEGFVASAAEVLLADTRMTNHSCLPVIFTVLKSSQSWEIWDG